MKGQRSAFTLIELVVVMAIMAIMGALVPMITSGVVLERQMYNTAAQLQQDLVLVQNMAITHSSGGPSISGGTRFVMRLYLSSNAFAYQTTEGSAALPVSNPTAATGIVVRQMPSTFRFASATVDASTSVTVTSGYVDVVFDNQGLAYWAVNGPAFQQATGSVMLTNSSLSKQIKVVVSPIGRATIEWVQR